MRFLDRLQRWLLACGWIAGSVFLIRFAFDFGSYAPVLLTIGFGILVVVAILVGGMGVGAALSGTTPEGVSMTARVLLLTAIPLGFLGSSLDCMGLSLAGCSPVCSFIKLAIIPLMVVLCGTQFVSGERWLLAAVSALSFATLIPHCVCRNPANAFWIDRVGASPVCYIWGFVISVISVGNLLAGGARVWISVLVTWTIIGGAFGFFVAHHYFHFPW